MHPRRLEFLRAGRAGRWVMRTALLALAPKCLLCLTVSAGLETALGLGGPEICGTVVGSHGSGASSLAWLVAGGGIAAGGLIAAQRRRRTAPASESTH